MSEIQKQNEDENQLENYDSLQIHYYLNNGLHEFDAFAHNACEKNFLQIEKEISKRLTVYTQVNVQAKHEGGLLDIYNFMVSDNGQVLAAWGALILSLLQLFLASCPHKDKGDKKEQELRIRNLTLQNEQLQLAIDKSKKEAADKLKIADNGLEQKVNSLVEKNIKIKKLQSNFFGRLLTCPEIEKIEVTLFSRQYPDKKSSLSVLRSNFESFLMETDDIDPLIDDNADIEIVSPVLKKRGRYTWRGIYAKNASPIEFSMSDKDFKRSVEDDDIPFQNGTFLNCRLETKRKLDDDGEIVNSGYKVDTVYNRYTGDAVQETPKGAEKRKLQEKDKAQLKLFDSDNPHII